MIHRIALSVLLAFAVMLPSAAAFAEAGPGPVIDAHDDSINLGRTGPYIQANGFFAQNLFDEHLLNISGRTVDAEDGVGVNVRAGYQFLSWLAVETMYEFATFDADTPGGNNQFTVDTHNILANLRLSLPVWRIQPYIILGIGGQRAQFDSSSPLNTAVSDDAEWNFVGRPGLGIDLLLTERWSVNFESAYSFGLTDYTSRLGRELDDLNYLSVGGGIRYRF